MSVANQPVPSTASHWTKSILPLLVILVLWLLFFWPMMAGQEIAGYRDSGYLYYPMFRWIDQEIAAGNFPLWMPFDDSGFPLLADGTSSMLYPGKLVFHLRFLSFPSRYGIYLAMHVLLAALGTFWLARTLKACPWGACVAAISFAFGGSLLFQVCNAIYLVSGAWLPVALTCVWKMLEGRSRLGESSYVTRLSDSFTNAFWAIAAGGSCAMMILGGDPQMVYNVGLITLVTIFCSSLTRTGQPFRKNFGALIVMVIVTSGLAAAQLIPTFLWAQHSDRMSTAQPLNVWQALCSEQPTASLNALADTPNGPPLTDIYQFSQEPWTVFEFLWSGIFGADAPVNTRWTAAFPGAERIWMPSIYFGAIPFVLAISGMRFWNSRSGKRRKGRAGQVWLSWIAVWFLLASFGWYGPVWLAKELSIPIGDGLNEGSFGVYWLMVTVLPKYILFRYPAKLVVIAVLALCVLAGIQTRPAAILKCARRWLGLATISLAGALVMLMPPLLEQLERCHSTGLYGPFQASNCQWEIVFSLLKTAFSAGAVWLICFVAKKTSDQNDRRRLRNWFGIIPAAIVVLIAFDLGFSNRWMLHPVPTSIITSPSSIASKIQQDRAAANLDPTELLSIDRTDRSVDFDPQWFEKSSPDRIAEIAQWRRESLFPKTHLDIPNVQVHGSFCSIMPAELDRTAGSNNEASLFEIARAADGFITATEAGPALSWNERPQPTAWIESAAADSTDPSALYCNCFWNGGKLTVNLPETNNEIQTDSDRRLVVRMLAASGWSANLLDAEGQTKTTLAVTRMDDFHVWVTVPPDHQRIELIYRPTELSVGLALSAVSILACLGYLLIGFRSLKSAKAEKAQ